MDGSGTRLTKKHTISLVFLLILLLIIPLGVYFVQKYDLLKLKAQTISEKGSWKTSEQSIKEGKLKPARKILEVNFAYDAKATPTLQITRMRKLSGYSSQHTNTNIDMKDKYVLKIINNQKTTLINFPFIIPNQIIVDSPPGQKLSQVPSTTLDQMKFTLTIPWYNNGGEIQIFDPQDKLIITQSLNEVVNVDNQPNFHSIYGADSSQASPKQNLSKSIIPEALAATDDHTYLDIVFIGDKYSTLEGFYYDVDLTINGNSLGGIKTVEPFRSRQAQLVFHRVDDVSHSDLCNISAKNCNWYEITNIANQSGVPYDKIVVIVNTTWYWGLAQINGDIATTSNTYIGPLTAVHELGHTIGRLEDEYVPDFPYQWPNRSDRNCYLGIPPNSGWAGIVPGDSYFWGCGTPFWYRSSQTSIMNAGGDGSDPTFNPISLKYMNDGIDIFTTTEPPICNLGDYKTTCLSAKCGEGDWCTQEVWQCNGTDWDFLYTECPFDYRCGGCAGGQPAPTPTSCNETWGACGSCSCGHPGECETHRKTDCSQECVWDPTRCAGPTATPTPIPCQAITSYGSPNPVLKGGIITFTFTSNGAYTNVGISPGDSTTCGSVTTSTNGFSLGTGTYGWRWTCSAGTSGGSFNAQFTNSQNCSASKAYTIAVPTPTPTRTPTPTLRPTATPTGTSTITGLTGSYYKDLTFSSLGTKNIGEIVNFNWGTGSPYKGVIPSDRFSVRWTGYIKPPYTGTYTFYTRTDDGVRLYVNNQLLVNKWVYQALTEYSASISLTANVKYPIRMDYFEGTGGAAAQLYFSGPNLTKQIIPLKYLYP